jgi:hypothetical protein
MMNLSPERPLEWILWLQLGVEREGGIRKNQRG